MNPSTPLSSPILSLGAVAQVLIRGILVLALALSIAISATSPSFAQGVPPHCDDGYVEEPLPDGQSFCIPEAEPTEPEADTRGANALALFYFSMGRTADGRSAAGTTCLTCDFIAYFTNAMANFSASVFTFFQEFFVILGPLLLAGWIAVRVIRLSINGGNGGGEFFGDMVRKLTLFFFAWMFLFHGYGVMGPVAPGHGSTGTTYFAGDAWHLTSPQLLQYSFALNGDIRSRTAAGLMDVGGGDIDSTPFQCLGLNDRVRGMVNNTSLNPSIHAITQTACVVERMHALGIATGVALVTSAWNQLGWNPNKIIGSVFKTIWGFILVGVYGLSAVWLVFLLLDVVTKALIVSSLLPLFGLAVMFPATRSIAQGALMQFVAVPVVAFALGLTSLLGFFLILGTVESYNSTFGLFNDAYNGTLTPISSSGTVERFAEFLRRIQLDSSDPEFVPADITSPWLHYLLLVGLGIFTLGKKIVSIIENIMGIQDTSSMADNAKRMAMTGAGAAMGAGMLTGKVLMSTIPVAGQIGMVAGGSAAYFAGRTASAMGMGGGGMANLGNRAARYGGRDLMQRVNPLPRKPASTGQKNDGE